MFLFVASVSHAENTPLTVLDKETWNKAIKRVITTPPCCGACPVLKMEDGRLIFDYLSGKSESPHGRMLFEENKEKILDAVKYFDASRYEIWSKLFLDKEKSK